MISEYVKKTKYYPMLNMTVGAGADAALLSSQSTGDIVLNPMVGCTQVTYSHKSYTRLLLLSG